jgi:hypothetical protein
MRQISPAARTRSVPVILGVPSAASQPLNCAPPYERQAVGRSRNRLRGFASGIKRDYAALKAALSLPWSQGQVEGQNWLRFALVIED